MWNCLPCIIGTSATTTLFGAYSCYQELKAPWLKQGQDVDATKMCNFRPGMTWRIMSWILSRAIMTSVTSAYQFNKVSMHGHFDTEKPALVVANHVSYMDGWMLNFFLHGGWSQFARIDFDKYFWTASSASLMFGSPLGCVISAVNKAVPIQCRYQYNADLSQNPEKRYLLDLNDAWLTDMAELVKCGNRVLYFPEGRIWQEMVETRSPCGRFVPQYECSDAIRLGSDPYDRVGPFYWGVAKVVARSNCKVVPVGHYGNQLVVPCGLGNTLQMSKVRWQGQHVHLEIGDEMDFTDMLEAFRKEHGITGPIVGNSVPEKQLYARITKMIRARVVECEKLAKTRVDREYQTK